MNTCVIDWHKTASTNFQLKLEDCLPIPVLTPLGMIKN
jgi:hypothetical protein